MTVTQRDRDLRACVQFLAADPWRFFHAQATHVAGPGGTCQLHPRDPWPCLTVKLAHHAEAMYRTRCRPPTTCTEGGHIMTRATE